MQFFFKMFIVSLQRVHQFKHFSLHSVLVQSSSKIQTSDLQSNEKEGAVLTPICSVLDDNKLSNLIPNWFIKSKACLFSWHKIKDDIAWCFSKLNWKDKVWRVTKRRLKFAVKMPHKRPNAPSNRTAHIRHQCRKKNFFRLPWMSN